MKNKTKSKRNTSPHPSTLLLIFSTSSPQPGRGTGNGDFGQFITLCFCCSFLLRDRLLTLLPCSSVGSLPWETIFHELIQLESFREAAVLHKLLQYGSLWRAVHRSCQKPTPARASHGGTASFRYPAWGSPWAGGGYLLRRGPPCGAGAQPASLGSSPWAAGESAVAPGASPHFSSLTLVSAGMFLSHILNHLFDCCCTAGFVLFQRCNHCCNQDRATQTQNTVLGSL